MDRLIRTVPAALEIRSDGRSVTGVCVPFDAATRVRFPVQGDVNEVFRLGSFTRTISERGAKIKLLANHNMDAQPIGRATSLVEEPHGLVGEFRISSTTAGDEALTLIRDGALDGFSVGFSMTDTGSRWSQDKRSVEHLEVRLHECSLTGFAAYPGAVVTGLRAESVPPALERNPRIWAIRFAAH